MVEPQFEYHDSVHCQMLCIYHYNIWRED